MKIYAVTGHRPQSIPNYSFTRLRALWEKLIFLADKIVYVDTVNGYMTTAQM